MRHERVWYVAGVWHTRTGEVLRVPPPTHPRGCQAYGYIDPKLSGSPESTSSARSRSPYSQAIVFIVGPGEVVCQPA
mgnify:CR=1 FL=1